MDLADAFEEENPDVEIKFVSIEEILELDGPGAEWPDDARRRLVSAADVSSVFYSTGAVQDGLLLDLGPLMEAERDFEPADFQPATLENFQSEGGTWAVPTEANYVVIYFSKDAFDEAGLDYPQPGWSWDDFLAAAEALTVREGDETTQWGFAEITPSPAFFVEGRTGPIYDMSTDPPSANFDDPAVADALRWYTELYQTHEVAPYFPAPDEEGAGLNIPEGYLVIEQGGAAMWPEASGSYPLPEPADECRRRPVSGGFAGVVELSTFPERALHQCGHRQPGSRLALGRLSEPANERPNGPVRRPGQPACPALGGRGQRILGRG